MPLQLMPAAVEHPASSVAEALENLVVASCPGDCSQEVTALLVALAAAAAAVAVAAAAAAAAVAVAVAVAAAAAVDVAGTEPAEDAVDAAGVAGVQQAVHHSAWTPCHADCP
jgi:hypothetical protein